MVDTAKPLGRVISRDTIGKHRATGPSHTKPALAMSLKVYREVVDVDVCELVFHTPRGS
jgi:hypothetical protein